uniref:IncA protein n=1 Tax=Panagrellus redivivus TaxID=6233 RepID=A0A7E4VHI8_PANRE
MEMDTARKPKSSDTDSVVTVPVDDEISFEIFEEPGDMTEFVPKLGIFGAPVCRLTTSVISLIGMMTGMVVVTGGLCIIVFFTQEPTITPFGITLCAVGGLLFTIGFIMWTSEFVFDDCLGRCYRKAKKAPLRNAIARRERIASRATTRTGSRLSTASIRTAATNVTSVSNKY